MNHDNRDAHDQAVPVDSAFNRMMRAPVTRKPLLNPELARHLEAQLQATFTGAVIGEWRKCNGIWQR